MYVDDETNDKTLRSVFFKIVLLVLALFVLMMLFPTKGFVKNYVDSKITSADNFNSNLYAMEVAGSGYFTSSRLPQNENDKVKLTLGDMYSKKMLVKFSDSNSKQCNLIKSYIEVTKEKDEYTMKVNLSCSDKTDYIMLHMGLDGTSFPSTSTARCEFVKNLDESWAYGQWSDWSTNKVEKSSTNQVETKVSKVKSGTQRVQHVEVVTDKAIKMNYNGKTVYVCATGYNNAGTYDSIVDCRKTVVNYVNEPIYKEVTYYRYRELTGESDTKWSDCDDESLIKQGYKKIK